MTPKEAAQKYAEDTSYIGDPNRNIENDAFLAGARFERERILGFMRSNEAFEHGVASPGILFNEEWADWLENKLKEPK